MEAQRSATNPDVRWFTGFAGLRDGGVPETATSYYVIPAGCRLGWHHNSAEETQFVVRGEGELLLEGEARTLRAHDLFLLEPGRPHDVRNTGEEELCVVAFFAEPTVEHHWRDDEWLPDGRRVTVTPEG